MAGSSVACGVDATAGDGEDLFTVNQLKTMNVAAGHTLTLDGQDGTDTYIVNTNGSLVAADHNYVINVLDTGAKDRGIDTLTVNGTADPDIFLLRQVSWIGKASNFSLENAETPAFVALLHGTIDDVWHRSRQDVERINYDENINARLIVNGLAGNDFFAVDDNASITTLDGGAGNDTFTIGQAYAHPRIAPDVAPEDAFPTVYTQLGWLSRGVSFPTTVFGGTGNDDFLVYSNKAALRLEGNEGDDLFAIRAAVLLDPATGKPLVDTFATPPPAPPRHDVDEDGDDDDLEIVALYNINAPVDVVGGKDCNTLVIVGTELIPGESGDEHQSKHGDQHRAETGLDVDDHIVVTGNHIQGAGLNVTFSGLGKEEDGNENDRHNGEGHDSDRHDSRCDTADCDGGLLFLGIDGGEGDGHDPALPVVSQDLTGISAAVNHVSVEPAEPRHGDDDEAESAETESLGGIQVHVATATSGQIIIREHFSTRVYEQNTTIDTFTVTLVRPSSQTVYVNVSAADAPSQPAALGARTVLVSIDNGATWQFAGVLTFTSGQMTKTVKVKAIDDLAPEGPLAAILSFSSQSADPTYNHAQVRNVLAEVIDNDQPGFVITQSDGDTTVLAGAPPQGIVDSYTIAPTMAPAPGTTVTITLKFDREDLVVSSADPRYNPVTRSITFDSTNWMTPATIDVTAAAESVDRDGEHGDEHDNHHDRYGDDLEGRIVHAVTSTDPRYTTFFAANPSSATVRAMRKATGTTKATTTKVTRTTRSRSASSSARAMARPSSRRATRPAIPTPSG
jgi:hypothetical protein